MAIKDTADAVRDQARPGGGPLTAPIAPPGLAGEAATARFGTFWRDLSEHRLGDQRMRDMVWFELDFHIPVDPGNGANPAWPRIEPDPRQGTQRVCRVYSSAALATQWLPPASGTTRLVHASGIEALRWLHAAPTPPDTMLIDWFDGSAAFAEVPVTLAVSAAFPHYQRIDDLETVERVGLARLGMLPPSAGLLPRVARALLFGWRELVGFSQPPEPFAYQGGHWLPVFSDHQQAFAFARTHREFRPARPGVAPPFLEWLAAARDVDGIVLDPESRRPLVLDHAALLLLDLWGPTPGEQPDGSDLVAAVVRQLAAGAISPRLAARLVADWPRYHLLAPPDSIGAAGYPEGARALVFTRLEEAERLRAHAGSNAEIVTLLHRCGRSVFHIVGGAFSGALVDPLPDATGGLTGGLALDDALVRVAAERVDQQLRPRMA